MTKFWKLSLITLLIIIFLGKGDMFDKYNTSIFLKSNRVVAQATTARKMEADRLLQQGIEQLANQDSRQADSSLTFFESALTIYREIQDRGGEGQALKNISNFYYQQQNYSQALDYAQQTLIIAQEIQDADLEARAFNNQGLIYYTQNNYPLAIESYQSGLLVIQQVSSQELELKLNLNLANAYKDSNDYNNYVDAVTHYEDALAIARKTNELYPQYIILNNLVEIYAAVGNQEQVNLYQQQALEVAQQIDANEVNSSPKKIIKGIAVPTIFNISLKGEIDGESFENLSGILEIQPASDKDPNPFMVSLATLDLNQTSPGNRRLGSLIWQSFTPGHPQEQEHYSLISVDNNTVRMEINPVNGYRSDIGWSTYGSLFDELRNLNEELERTEEEFNLPKQEEDVFDEDLIPIPNQPNSLQVVPRSGVLTFSIQGDRIVGSINASGITSSEINQKAKVSTYQAEFVGEPIQAQSNNKRVEDFDLLERNNLNVNQTKATRKNSSIDKFFINKELKKN